MKKAFGAIDLLIGLLITTAIFMVCISSFKGISINPKDADTRSVKEHVDATSKRNRTNATTIHKYSN